MEGGKAVKRTANTSIHRPDSLRVRARDQPVGKQSNSSPFLVNVFHLPSHRSCRCRQMLVSMSSLGLGSYLLWRSFNNARRFLCSGPIDRLAVLYESMCLRLPLLPNRGRGHKSPGPPKQSTGPCEAANHLPRQRVEAVWRSIHLHLTWPTKIKEPLFSFDILSKWFRGVSDFYTHSTFDSAREGFLLFLTVVSSI